MDMMETGKMIEKVLLVISGILIVFDIYLYLNKSEGDTISNILKGWVYDKFFFITYLWGVLAGHFFLGTHKPPFDSNSWSLVIVLSVALVLLLIGLLTKKKVKPIGQVFLLCLGTAIGHFFWSLQ